LGKDLRGPARAADSLKVKAYKDTATRTTKEFPEGSHLTARHAPSATILQPKSVRLDGVRCGLLGLEGQAKALD
jgi:hypothetical protein